MFWLRTLFYVSPLALAFAVVLLFREVSRLALPGVGEALTTSIREPIGPLNPLVPISGPTREVRDLIFEPLLIRDDDLNLRPHLLASWEKQTVVMVRCFSEEAAGEAEAMINSGEYLDPDLRVLGLNREGSVLTIALDGFGSGLETRLISKFDPGLLGDYLLVRLRLKHSIRDSFGTFLNSSVEKGQIKMLDYEGDEVVNLFVKGDTDLFLRELELYYESNLSLSPEIEVVGERSFTSSRELSLKLRGDAKWHDGRPVTARDVIFSYEELTRDGSVMPLKGAFWFVETLEASDDFSLRVVCRSTPAVMMEAFEALPILPEHLLGDPGDQDRWEKFFAAPVGFGPYQLERRREDGGVVLKAFPGYFGPGPLQEWNVYRRFDSLESKLLALRSGRVDLLIPDERFSDWSERNPGMVREIRCLPRFQYFIAWNLDVEPLDQNPVRTALAKAVDLTAVLASSATDYQEPVRSLFFPGVPYIEEAMPLPLLDLREAEKLLEEAGYPFDERQGARVGKSGETLTLKLTVNEADHEQIRMARALQNQWSAVGVVVNIEELPWEEILNNRLLTREFQGVILSWEIPLKRDRYETWHSKSIEEGSGNLFGLRNQVIDELLVKLRETEVPGEVSPAAHQLQEEIAALQPCFFIAQSGRILTLRDGAVEVARPAASGEPVFSPAGLGKAGLERSRPRWVRSSAVKAPPTEVPIEPSVPVPVQKEGGVQ